MSIALWEETVAGAGEALSLGDSQPPASLGTAIEEALKLAMQRKVQQKIPNFDWVHLEVSISFFFFHRNSSFLTRALTPPLRLTIHLYHMFPCPGGWYI
jgi:hypothetical protein